MEVVGYQLVNSATNEVVQSWGGFKGEMPAVPNPINIPDFGPVFGPAVGVDYGGYELREWAVENPQLRVPQMISRRQCSLQLLAIGMITGPEAVDMARSGIAPPNVVAYISQLPPDQQYVALIDFAAAAYYRDNPLLNALMLANGNTPAEIDAFFIAAAAL